MTIECMVLLSQRTQHCESVRGLENDADAVCRPAPQRCIITHVTKGGSSNGRSGGIR